MRRTLTPILFLFSALGAFAAEAADANDAKLREALRNVTLQLRAAESDRASLQSAQSTLAEENKTLAAKLDALKKDVVTERTATDKTIATLKAQLAAQEAELARTKETAEQSEAKHKEAAALAAAKETERTKLAAENIALQRVVADREAKNLALFKLGNEILARYEKFSLGEALEAREPFVGRTRAKLETLVQDYEDKLADNRVK
ncbi:MAG TPA: phage major capsid protein [Opitutaceae bacterium]|nr:phage major capsid protein [Opitutaceae bacterium]